MAGFMIAAPRSGSGKTMVTCGILELLKRKQKNPFSYKCGPDYIDGLFHRKVLGIEGGNLDSFFEQPQDMREKYAAVSETHFPVVEGVMGYFDGLGGDTTAASSWEVADILDLPVVLVVDAKGASLSLAALIKGFQVFQGESQLSQANKNGNHIQAVILNRISPMLYRERNRCAGSRICTGTGFLAGGKPSFRTCASWGDQEPSGADEAVR